MLMILIGTMSRFWTEETHFIKRLISEMIYIKKQTKPTTGYRSGLNPIYSDIIR